jgi:hypothetical protein
MSRRWVRSGISWLRKVGMNKQSATRLALQRISLFCPVKAHRLPTGFDRAPTYTGAVKTCWWELLLDA